MNVVPLLQIRFQLLPGAELCGLWLLKFEPFLDSSQGETEVKSNQFSSVQFSSLESTFDRLPFKGCLLLM